MQAFDDMAVTTTDDLVNFNQTIKTTGEETEKND